jgi:hypothetical protein
MVGVVPALGADGAVTTSGNTFSPSSVTINAGEQVTFTNGGGGMHDLQFDDRATPEISPPSTSAWTVSRRFDQPGSYGFRCNVHTGMTGTVVVNPAPAPPPAGSPPPSPTPPGATPPPPAPPGGTAPPSGTAPTAAQPPTLAARVLTRRACTRKSATCKRPGIRISVTAQEAVVVTGQLRRRARRAGFRPSGRVRFSAAKGRSTVSLLRRVGGARIGPGDYRLTLTAVRAAPGSDGTRSSQVALRFAVRR